MTGRRPTNGHSLDEVLLICRSLVAFFALPFDELFQAIASFQSFWRAVRMKELDGLSFHIMAKVHLSRSAPSNLQLTFTYKSRGFTDYGRVLRLVRPPI